MRMRISRMIGLGLAAYSAYRMVRGMSGSPRTLPRAPGSSYSPMPSTGTRPGIDLMKRHSGRRPL